MANHLPSRPNLDHLRRQAKDLLASLLRGDPKAAHAFRRHLPAARDMDADGIRAAGFRLADAQSAVARQNGFEAWPRLAKHVEQLRALEGTWRIARLNISGQPLGPGAAAGARLLIDGDLFRMESPEAVYEGEFNIDVDAQPHHIDIDFVQGPEAGSRNMGIFRLTGDDLEICLDMSGSARPAEFRAPPGAPVACETWRRESGVRPESVTGGHAATAAAPLPAPPPVDEAAFAFVPSATLDRLQGEWGAQRIVRDGDELMPMMCKTARRSAIGNQVKITVMGHVIIDAKVRIDESATPIHIDYFNLAGPARGMVQRGIMEWKGEDVCFCMAAPGADRPTEFECPRGSGRTLSRWSPK